MSKIHILLYYKFVDIENPSEFVEKHMEFCKSIGLKGKILVSKEGINGSVSGTINQTEKYKEYLRSDSRFSDIVFKEDIGLTHPFTKMAVRVKPEIIAMKKKVNLDNKAPYVEPSELREMYEKGEDFVIVDARNDYEWKVGKFKNAITLPIKTFREFPDAVKRIEKFKNKKIITYCTGGIRCEKASAYLVEQGFENVFQLKDGILTYCKEFPEKDWEGKCFVFDKRVMSDVNGNKDEITSCEVCNGSCDLYRNCRSIGCNRFVVMCVSCEDRMNGCCSDKCFSDFREQCVVKSRMKQGRRALNVKN